MQQSIHAQTQRKDLQPASASEEEYCREPIEEKIHRKTLKTEERDGSC